MFEELAPVWGYVAAGFLVGIGFAAAFLIRDFVKERQK